MWTGIATVSFAVGSLILYDGVSASWITILLTLVGMTLAMVADADDGAQPFPRPPSVGIG